MILTTYRVHFLIEPSAPFGLPDGAKVVIPTSPEDRRTYTSPVLDTRTGLIASYGTLSEYRRSESPFVFEGSTRASRIRVRDNLLECTVEAETPGAAYDLAERELAAICRGLTVTYGARFSASFRFIEMGDGQPLPHPRPRIGLRFTATWYNFDQLRAQFTTAETWARASDARVNRALLYAEHAHVLQELALSDDASSDHTAFTYALAFLQLFKAVTAVLGEPGRDRDYQRRFRQMGLPEDFWEQRVRPLYDVRNDEDVAHYSLKSSSVGDVMKRFRQATEVLRDSVVAYVTWKSSAPTA